MKIGAYSTLIVAVILGVILTTSLMVPVIANVDSGQTEEKLVPTEVNSKTYYYNVGAYGENGTMQMILPDPAGSGDYIEQNIDPNQLRGIYTTFSDLLLRAVGIYWVKTSTDWRIYVDFVFEGNERTFDGVCTQSELEEKYAFANYLTVYIVVVDRGLTCRLLWADGSEIYGIRTLVADNKIVGYWYSNQYRALRSGYTLNPTTEAYFDTQTPTSGGFTLANAVNINNTLVGYTDETMTTPIYAFNKDGVSDLFAIPYASSYEFWGLYEDTITIYQMKDVPVDSPIKWVLAIIPVMVLVGIIVTVIQTQITQKRD